ncbi:MAG: ABC transporter [Anaerolineae bacterium SG8_19]|jgi:hypothetical protein|nr:MAG: ABC transporter [Anaerolineae bacterium SG8_19]
MDDGILREQLIQVLTGRNAHFTFNDAVKDFPVDKINEQPPNVPYTPWHLVEHLRIAQWDILEFTQNPDHVSPRWPEGYWPDRDAIADVGTWQASLAAFRSDLKAVEEIVLDRDIDLSSEIPHAPGYTYLREVLLVADHNAYHIGEFCILRQVMGTW